MFRTSILAVATLFAMLAFSPGVSQAVLPDDLYPSTYRIFDGVAKSFNYSGLTIDAGLELKIKGRLNFKPSDAVPYNSSLGEILYENFPRYGFLDICFIEFYRNGDINTLDALLTLQNRPQSIVGTDYYFGQMRYQNVQEGHALMNGVVFLDGDVNIQDVQPGPDGIPVFTYTGSGNVLLIKGAVMYKNKTGLKNGVETEKYKYKSSPIEAGRAYVSGGVLQEDTWRPASLRIKLNSGKYWLVSEEYLIAP